MGVRLIAPPTVPGSGRISKTSDGRPKSLCCKLAECDSGSQACYATSKDEEYGTRDETYWLDSVTQSDLKEGLQGQRERVGRERFEIVPSDGETATTPATVCSV